MRHGGTAPHRPIAKEKCALLPLSCANPVFCLGLFFLLFACVFACGVGITGAVILLASIGAPLAACAGKGRLWLFFQTRQLSCRPTQQSCHGRRRSRMPLARKVIKKKKDEGQRRFLGDAWHVGPASWLAFFGVDRQVGRGWDTLLSAGAQRAPRFGRRKAAQEKKFSGSFFGRAQGRRAGSPRPTAPKIKGKCFEQTKKKPGGSATI
ncbi:hypothetical protein TW95_gp0155 [Pandoravirus inopinatum]|uniref:Transmembrane protein n=1 Tax=Pandoravirus inopinatum TaxID=1605721 RepID=A0A0B5J0C0_9VIRU|nr:hypothetical protein TW95_gp0155 [Pandoravirus inopinatum]AJF96889.1 hypothetical protein [Pandoravirus inopinatum]